MHFINFLIDFVIHLDIYLSQIIFNYGLLTYAILFVIIFMGLVVTPFLPGDSLLFAVGALAALGALNIFWLLGLLTLAAICGDNINYWLGYFFGERLSSGSLIKKKYIGKTQEFFNKHGLRTLILARFIPIIRTFTPLVAGISKMPYRHFFPFSIIGAFTWVFAVTLAGFFFGNISLVKNNFSVVIIVIIIISIIPLLVEAIKDKSKSKRKVKND